MRNLLPAGLLLCITLGGCSEGVLDPKGLIAVAEREILFDSLGIMLAIGIPTILAILGTAFWFRASNARAGYLPDFTYSGRLELLVWSIPAMTVLLVGGVAWIGARDLDPRRPIASTVKPIVVQVVSLDWKWLFIYPDQGVASVNHLDRAGRHPGQLRADLVGRDEQLLRASTWQPDLYHVGHGDPSLAPG
jgi:cytochrome o ubiquinol oxidase subunit 2